MRILLSWHEGGADGQVRNTPQKRDKLGLAVGLGHEIASEEELGAGVRVCSRAGVVQGDRRAPEAIEKVERSRLLVDRQGPIRMVSQPDDRLSRPTRPILYWRVPPGAA